eukprot:tig00001215_g7583.t1
MPAAKKPGKKKKTRRRKTLEPEFVPKSVVESLEQRLKVQQAELENARTQLNFYRLESEKLTSELMHQKRSLELQGVEHRNRLKDVEWSERRHRDEIKVLREKLRTVESERNSTIASIKASDQEYIRLLTEQYKAREKELKEDKAMLEQRLREIEISHDAHVQSITESFEQEIARLKHEMEEPVLLGVFRGSGGGGPGVWEFMRPRPGSDETLSKSRVRALVYPRQRPGDGALELSFRTAAPSPLASPPSAATPDYTAGTVGPSLPPAANNRPSSAGPGRPKEPFFAPRPPEGPRPDRPQSAGPRMLLAK